MERQQFKTTVFEVLSEKGFRKKGSVAHIESNGLIILFGIQKSYYADAYYLNIGVLFKDIHPEIVSL